MSTIWLEGCGGRVRGKPRLGWVGGLREQRNNGGGSASMREKSERVESPGTCVTE